MTRTLKPQTLALVSLVGMAAVGVAACGSSEAEAPGGSAGQAGQQTGGANSGGSQRSAGGSNSGGSTGGRGGSTPGAGGSNSGGSSAGTGGSTSGAGASNTGGSGSTTTGGSQRDSGTARPDAGAVVEGGARSDSGAVRTDAAVRADSGAAAGAEAGRSGDAGALPDFSFFVTSLVAMRALSGSQNGFGGDLRYGQANGLAGADKICADTAERSMAGSSVKQWRAFLSTTQVNAATRIGQGPWYDRRGRLVAATLADLLQARPNGANVAIKEDLPNEDGTPNHRPDPTQPEADNHHMLTGSDTMGRLYVGQGGVSSTCLDWTSSSRVNTAAGSGRPRFGYSWSVMNRTHWFSGGDEGGCAAGVAIEPNPGPDPSNPIVGSGGGYGGIYCFALTR